jgi:hypothetical protein
METRTKSIVCIYCEKDGKKEDMISNVCKDCYLK